MFTIITLISIHAPLAGSDEPFEQDLIGQMYFNPRSPCGERRHCLFLPPLIIGFQSTLPLRGATEIAFVYPSCRKFQSTLPLRGATLAYFDDYGIELISIHAPLAGSDGSWDH